MAGVSPGMYSAAAQQPQLTPSPFTTISVASTTGWRSHFTHQLSKSNLLLRFFALLVSFISAVSLAAQRQQKKGETSANFTDYPEYIYFFTISVFAFIYSAFQLFKSISDIAYKGFLISDRIFDYVGFVLDQMVCYLIMSSSSVALPVTYRIAEPLRKAAIVSVTMSFTAFLVIAASALLSGYKLCKRIIW